MKTLKELLDQNPVFKGGLYFTIPALGIISANLAKWGETPPANPYQVGWVAAEALLAGLTALKAFTSNPVSKSDKVKLG